MSILYTLYIIKLDFSIIDQCKSREVKSFLIKKTIKHDDSWLENFKTHAIIAFVTQLIIITYVTKFQSRKLYFELSEIQRCKNYSNSIVEHWVILRWNFNKFNFVNLRSQNKDAKRCRASRLIAKFIELNSYKRSKHHNSIRNDRIWIIFALLNFAQFIIQLTSSKHFNIYDD